ncbi:MAG TPA: anti-sigma factor antagonist [Ruminococcaceae bacterium]|nr:anti-sigma factor antagonist [Oscillospiraceae bacterium]
MNIIKTNENNALTLAIQGRLDTTTAPELEQVLQSELDGVALLRMDFEQLEYISSAGLRVLLSAQKRMNKQGDMVVCNVNETVAEVFEITGFSDVLNIE